MSDRGMQDMLGPVGVAALGAARRALEVSHPGTDAALAWARWTPTEWKFTFRQRVPPRRLALHVPHDGSDVVIRLLAPTDRPDV